MYNNNQTEGRSLKIVWTILTSKRGLARMAVVGLFLDPKKPWKSRRTSRICENLAYEIYFLRGFFPPTFTFHHGLLLPILFAMFTEVGGPPEKPNLALVPRSYVLRMIVKLAYFKIIFQLPLISKLRRVPFELDGWRPRAQRERKKKTEFFFFNEHSNDVREKDWPIQRANNNLLCIIDSYGW